MEEHNAYSKGILNWKTCIEFSLKPVLYACINHVALVNQCFSFLKHIYNLIMLTREFNFLDKYLIHLLVKALQTLYLITLLD